MRGPLCFTASHSCGLYVPLSSKPEKAYEEYVEEILQCPNKASATGREQSQLTA